MRVTEIDLVSDTFEEALNFRLAPAKKTGQYQIRQIVGLDADEINQRFYVGGQNKESKYYEAYLKPREIVMRVILNPRFNLDENYSDVRDELYRYISKSRSRQLSLHFKSGTTAVSKIDGYISKFEAVHFTKLPEVQITITCPNPIFKALSYVELPDFVSNHVNGVINVPDSLSTAPHGCVIEATYSTDNNSSFSFYDKEHAYTTFFSVGYSSPYGNYDIGDKVFVSSESGSKDVWAVYTEYPSSQIGLMSNVDAFSSWPIIFPGNNQFFFNALKNNKLSSLKIKFIPTYWGV